MKKNLLFFFVLFTFFANGQTSIYRPFPTNNGNWIYQYYDDFGNPTSTFNQYTLNGDTTFSSINYKKIYTLTGYAGAIRESSKIVYFVPDTSSSEFVLYDFNLIVGDTIFSPYGGAVCSNDTAVVQYEDSVLVSDGYHRRLWLSSFSRWIEGIGSEFYLLNPSQLLCLSGNDRLSCFVGDSTNYPSTSTACILSTNESINYSNNISIYPNPSNGSFTIDYNNIDAEEIQLTDLLGNLILCERIKNKEKILIDNLERGIYILSIKDKEGKIANRKIVNNR